MRIEFNEDNLPLAESIGIALTQYARHAGGVQSFDEVIAKFQLAEVKSDVEAEDAIDTTDDERDDVTDPAPDTTKAFSPPAKLAAKLADGSKRLDEKGITFDPEYCADARDPFYSSGSRSGQWKKGRGLEFTVYDSWYAGELLKLGALAKASGPITGPVPDTTAAFGGTPASKSDDNDNEIPTDPGSLMVWLSEMQTAGRLDQTGIDNAYTDSGFTPGDLFSGKDGAVRGIYEALKGNLK